MGTTAVDLFRAGNKSGPRMDHVRVPADVTTKITSGIDFVTGKSGGVSTYESKDPSLGGTWWGLPAGSDYDDNALFLKDDQNGHWEWQPAHDMPLDDYKAALASLNRKFTFVP